MEGRERRESEALVSCAWMRCDEDAMVELAFQVATKSGEKSGEDRECDKETRNRKEEKKRKSENERRKTKDGRKNQYRINIESRQIVLIKTRSQLLQTKKSRGCRARGLRELNVFKRSDERTSKPEKPEARESETAQVDGGGDYGEESGKCVSQGSSFDREHNGGPALVFCFWSVSVLSTIGSTENTGGSVEKMYFLV